MTAAAPAPNPWRWTALLSLAIGAAAAGLAAMTPAPVAPSATASRFSAERAMTDLRVIAARPHPTGSAASHQVDGYLVARLQAMGLETNLQAGEGLLTSAKRKPGVVIAGAVRNITGVLPGRDRNVPAVLVMAHYDTMPNTPGAGDDTAGAASALEIARALKADGARARDVIFLFTDGEEPGLLGAQAFFASNPLARRVGVVINMEARGDAGRAVMFETSSASGGLVRLVAARSPGAGANSLMAALYRVMPNDTDLTIALDRGVAGLNFAFGGDQLAYHTSLSTPDHLDRGSLQHLGDVVLPVVRDLAQRAALPAGAPDLTYSDLLGRVLVAYPPGVGWTLTFAAGIAIAISVVLIRRRCLASWGDLVRGGGGLALALLAAALGLHLAGRLLGGEDSVRVYVLVARYPLLLAGAAAIALAAVLGVAAGLRRGARRLPAAIAAVLAGAACSVGGFDLAGAVLGLLTAAVALLALGRATSVWGTWGGALILGLAAAAALQAAVPTGAFIVQWPLLLAALTAAGLLAGRMEPTSGAGALVLGVAGAVGFAQVASWAASFFVQMGPVFPELLALFAPLAVLLLAPGFHALGQGRLGRTLPLSLALLGVVLLAPVGGVAGVGASPRQLTQVFYLADPGSHRFYRGSATRDLEPWSRAALEADGGAPVPSKDPLLASGRIWLARAKPLDVAGPQLLADTRRIGDRTQVVLHVSPGAAGRELKLLIQPTRPLRNMTLNGRPLDALEEAAHWSLNRMGVVYVAPPAEGVVLTFEAPAHGRLAVTALEIRDGWPAGVTPPPPRPGALLTWGLSDTTLARTALAYSW